MLRDRFCRDEGCGLPGRDCQIDHVTPRSKGGLTAESNGECKCGTANRLKGDRMP
jgi:5-methylcytosine-specific restriction endonuclease McrA